MLVETSETREDQRQNLTVNEKCVERKINALMEEIKVLEKKVSELESRYNGHVNNVEGAHSV